MVNPTTTPEQAMQLYSKITGILGKDTRFTDWHYDSDIKHDSIYDCDFVLDPTDPKTEIEHFSVLIEDDNICYIIVAFCNFIDKDQSETIKTLLGITDITLHWYGPEIQHEYMVTFA